MAYYSSDELKELNFRSLGTDVKISNKASFYDCEKISIGDYSRIDDFCIVSGEVSIGRFVHITPMCLIAGGIPGVIISDFCTLAYGVKIFAQSDDYSGNTMVGSLIPKNFKNETFSSVKMNRQVIVGTNSVVMPGVEIGEGCSFGAMTLINKSTAAWGIYVGSPCKRIKERSKKMLELENVFIKDTLSDKF
ncbi:acyltransferase [Shewanella sp. S1-58-MNA-CIBAN-0166]|uniref:acyltransferase n=1 Tax=Shewanella sp. S1-58-MNA-CIBAN-0166 TaxID=3140467 RepID=UPI003326F2EF